MQQSNSSQKLNFSAFKSSFTSNVSALKRRFSSGDLENDGNFLLTSLSRLIYPGMTPLGNNPLTIFLKISPGYEEQAKEVISSVQPDASTSATPQQPQQSSGVPPPNSKTTSAPTSPSRSSSVNIFQKLQSSVSGVASNISSNIQQVCNSGGFHAIQKFYK